MRFMSLCAGIEAASVAWNPLGFKCIGLAEIEAFPSAVTAHHYPDVPNFGDIARFDTWPDDAFAKADIIVGGPPCQAFSISGLRKGLNDDRGNLTLTYVKIIDHADRIRNQHQLPPVISLYENVPGLLSDKTGAFGSLLAGLAGEDVQLESPGKRWTDAGCVSGPKRTVAWRTLDAQFFQLAQRRRRVFVVASARKGFDPAAVLLEFEGVRRDSPPRREKRQDASAGAPPGVDQRRSHWDGVEHPHPTLNQSFNTGAIGYSNQELFSQRGAGLVGEASTGEISHCLNAGGMGRQDYETETLVTHALRGEGFDASEDGTGRGTPLVPVAFSSKDHGADASADLSPTLRAMPHHSSHANGGGQMAVAVPLLEVGKRTGPSSTDDIRAGLGIGEDGDPMYTLQAGAQHGVAAYAFQRRIARNGRGDMGDVVNALTMSGETGKGDTAPCVALPMMVRRLVPVEAERLQGFQDSYTAIPWRNRPAEDCPDGPRYRALGNSMAVNVMRWIGERIRAAADKAEDGRVP